MGIVDALNNFAGLPSAVKLVAVSKFKPLEDVLEAYTQGQRLFGENRPQELMAKATDARTPNDIQWHFIGHLQTNKIKMVVPYASVIQSIDSEKLLKGVNDFAQSIGKVQDCLLEVHISSDETKQGFSREELIDLSARFDSYPAIRFCGVMGMASLTDDMGKVRGEFRSLRLIRDELKARGIETFNDISMGMSHDYPLAIEEGATYIRIGTAIFGAR